MSIDYNILLAKKTGSVNSDIILREIVKSYQYHKSRNELEVLRGHKGEWFCLTMKLCEEKTGLTRNTQGPAIDLLIKMGFIKKVIAEYPPKRFFQINELKIIENMKQ